MASMAPAGGGGRLITLITHSLDQIIPGGWTRNAHPISTLSTGEDIGSQMCVFISNLSETRLIRETRDLLFLKNQDSPIFLIIEIETSYLVHIIFVQICTLKKIHFLHQDVGCLVIHYYIIYAIFSGFQLKMHYYAALIHKT